MKVQSFLYENKPNEAIKGLSDYRTFAEKENIPKEVVWSYASEGFILSENGETAEGLKKYQQAADKINTVNLSKEDKETMTKNYQKYLTYAFAMDNQFKKAKEYLELYRKTIEGKASADDTVDLDWLSSFIEFK